MTTGMQMVATDAPVQASGSGLPPRPLPANAQKIVYNRCTVGSTNRIQIRLLKPPKAVTANDAFLIDVWKQRIIIVLKIVELAFGNKFAFGADDLVQKWMTQLQHFFKNLNTCVMNH